MRFTFTWSLPAVSTSTRRIPRLFARAMPSKATAAGSAPGSCFTISTPARSAQIPSWSAAAARKVSQATRRTESPARLY